MSTNSGISPKAVKKGMELRLNTAIDGLKTAIPASLTSLFLGGVPRTIADLLTTAEQLEKPWQDMRDAHATIRAVMLTRARDTEAARKFLGDLKGALGCAFGRDSQELHKFGFIPQTPRTPLTPEQKLLSAAKAKLTRAKRHTMGTVQKAALRETGTPVVTVGPDGTLIAPPISKPTTAT